MSWLLAIPAANAAGILFFTVLARQNPAYLSSFREHVSYFFSPFGPGLMMLVKRLDGSTVIHYDVVVESSEKGHVIHADDGTTYVAEEDPRRAQMVALVDARGQINQPSPFGYTWRVLAGWMVSSIILWIAFVNTWLDNVIRDVQPDWVAWLLFMALVLDIFYVMGVVMPRLYGPSVRLAAFVEAGYNPPYTVLVPSCSPWDNTSVDECTRWFGGRIYIKVPQSLMQLVEELRKEHGSYTLSAAIAAKLDEGVKARKTISELKRRMITEVEAAKALIGIESWRLATRITVKKAALMILAFLLGLAIGAGMAGDWSISVQPPAYNASEPAAVQQPLTPAQPPQPPAEAQVTTTPAPPPPPPTAGETITPALPPPPPNVTEGGNA